jgi:hemerythrin superfamily protein
MDAIALLKADHQRVQTLFERFKKTGDRAYKTREKVVEEIIKELSVHAVIEEQVFYPAVKERIPDLRDDVLEGIEEHHIVKWTLSELDGMDPEDESYKAKVTVLIESVEHHVEEEEKDMFPEVRKALPKSELDDLGEVLERAKAVAPTKPHPRAPAHGVDVSDLVANVTDRLTTVADKVTATRDKLATRIRQQAGSARRP